MKEKVLRVLYFLLGIFIYIFIFDSLGFLEGFSFEKFSKEYIENVVIKPEEPIELDKDVEIIIKGKIIEIKENTIYVNPIQDYPLFYNISNDSYAAYEYIFLHTDILGVNLEDVAINCSINPGEIIDIYYNFANGITGQNPFLLNGVKKIEKPWEREHIVLYNGRFYYDMYLSDKTLEWLKMTDEERKKSDYYPEDLVTDGYTELKSEALNWGIFLSIKEVTPTGLYIVCEQKDFIPTTTNDDLIITMDDFYSIEKLEKTGWEMVKNLSYLKNKSETTIDMVVKQNDIVSWPINWNSIYGALPEGIYRFSSILRTSSEVQNISIMFKIE